MKRGLEHDEKEYKKEHGFFAVPEPVVRHSAGVLRVRRGQDKEALIGSWETTLDLTDMMNDEISAGMGGGDELMSYFTISDFTITLTLTFRDDDSYTLSADESSMEKSVDKALAAFREGFTKYLEDMVAEEYPDMTLDEFLEAMDTAIDGFYDQILGDALSKEDLMSAADEMESGGTFKAKNGILTLTGEGVEDGTLTGLYPLIFTKK